MSYTAFRAAYREMLRQGIPPSARLVDVVGILTAKAKDEASEASAN